MLESDAAPVTLALLNEGTRPELQALATKLLVNLTTLPEGVCQVLETGQSKSWSAFIFKVSTMSVSQITLSKSAYGRPVIGSFEVL